MIVPRTRLCYRRAAFTIIEVLTAIAIFSGVMVMIYSSWEAIMRGTASGLKAAAGVQRSRVAINAVEESLSTAQMFHDNAYYYAFVADTSDKMQASLMMTSRLPPTFPGSGLYGDIALRRVMFKIVPDNDGTRKLVLIQEPILLKNEDLPPYTITLVKDITWFVLEFWDPQKNDWFEEFLATNQLPKMMRVTIGWGHSPRNASEPAEVVTRVVALTGSTVMPEMQTITPLGGRNNRP